MGEVKLQWTVIYFEYLLALLVYNSFGYSSEQEIEETVRQLQAEDAAYEFEKGIANQYHRYEIIKKIVILI